MSIDADFYTTTAQVIPTVVLTLVVERRFLDREVDQNPAASLAWVTFVMGALVVGEGAALAGAAGHGNAWFARVIVLAIGLGGFHLVGFFLLDRMGRDLEAAREGVPRHPYLLGCLVPLVVLVNVVLAFAPLLVALYVAIFAI
jgi:hypothetical protein